MRRRRKETRRVDVYSSNISRYSVYPDYREAGTQGKHAKRPEVRIGDLIEVRIVSIDEDGYGIGSYRGYRVLVEAASPGERINARVKAIRGNTIYAERTGSRQQGGYTGR